MGFRFFRKQQTGWHFSEPHPELHQRIAETDIAEELYVALYSLLD